MSFALWAHHMFTVGLGAVSMAVVSAASFIVALPSGETRMSYVKFTTGSLPAGAAIIAAELRLPVDSKPIAARLTLSVKTVESHVSNVLRKLQLSTRHELARWATEHRLV